MIIGGVWRSSAEDNRIGREKVVEAKRAHQESYVLGGDEGRIRSREEILRTLNSADKLDGCLLMEQMWDYCGLGVRVLKAW